MILSSKPKTQNYVFYDKFIVERRLKNIRGEDI
jgi:hypothetical protein